MKLFSEYALAVLGSRPGKQEPDSRLRRDRWAAFSLRVRELMKQSPRGQIAVIEVRGFRPPQDQAFQWRLGCAPELDGRTGLSLKLSYGLRVPEPFAGSRPSLSAD